MSWTEFSTVSSSTSSGRRVPTLVVITKEEVNFHISSVFAVLISKHPLALPITKLSVLPDGRFAGLVNTKSKRGRVLGMRPIHKTSSGIAIYEFPDGASTERIPPKLFKPIETK